MRRVWITSSSAAPRSSFGSSAVITIQGISYSLLCNWFRNAVLPADHELLADVMRERPGKRCAVCGKPVYSSSNRAKYCPACAKQERRKQDAKRKREQNWNLRK